MTSGQLGRVLKAASSLIGVETGSPEHLKLVREITIASIQLPVGHPVKNTDDWRCVCHNCLPTRSGLSHLIGRECGGNAIFKSLKSWYLEWKRGLTQSQVISLPLPGPKLSTKWWICGSYWIVGIRWKWTDSYNRRKFRWCWNRENAIAYRIGNGNIRGFATLRYRYTNKRFILIIENINQLRCEGFWHRLVIWTKCQGQSCHLYGGRSQSSNRLPSDETDDGHVMLFWPINMNEQLH